MEATAESPEPTLRSPKVEPHVGPEDGSSDSSGCSGKRVSEGAAERRDLLTPSRQGGFVPRWEWEQKETVRQVLAAIIKGLRMESLPLYASNLLLGLWILFIAYNKQYFLFNTILTMIFVIVYESVVDNIIGVVTEKDNMAVMGLYEIIEKIYDRCCDIAKHVKFSNYFVRFSLSVIFIVIGLLLLNLVTGRIMFTIAFVLIVVIPPIHKIIRLKDIVNRLGKALNRKSLQLLNWLKKMERFLGEEDEGIMNSPILSPLTRVVIDEQCTPNVCNTPQHSTLQESVLDKDDRSKEGEGNEEKTNEMTGERSDMGREETEESRKEEEKKDVKDGKEE